MEMKDLTDIELVGEMWRRRVEWMWTHWNAEYADGIEAPKAVDIGWLDEQIDKEEAANAGEAPKG